MVWSTRDQTYYHTKVISHTHKRKSGRSGASVMASHIEISCICCANVMPASSSSKKITEAWLKYASAAYCAVNGSPVEHCGLHVGQPLCPTCYKIPSRCITRKEIACWSAISSKNSSRAIRGPLLLRDSMTTLKRKIVTAVDLHGNEGTRKYLGQLRLNRRVAAASPATACAAHHNHNHPPGKTVGVARKNRWCC